MANKKKVTKNTGVSSPAGICGIIMLIGVILLASMYAYNNYSGSPSISASTFKAYSYTDGEDVSNFLELTIWTWDTDKTYNDPEDLRNINNFEATLSDKDTEDISIDITGYLYGIWIEVDDDVDTVFENDFIWLSTASNVEDYPIYCYHLSSDVNFNVLTSTLDEISSDCTTDGNYSLFYDFPGETGTNTHVGTNWAIEDLDDYTVNEIGEVLDERNWRCQAPTYVITSDVDDDYSKTFEKFTEVFGIKISMNESISTVDGNAAQVNCTIAEEYSELVTVQVSGYDLLLLFSDVITGPGQIEFELDFGSTANINATNIYSGRIAVTGDASTASWSSTYSSIGA